MPTFYDILGVSRTAPHGEIHKRYMQLIREHHPDRFTDPTKRAEAEKRVMEITEAFNVLRNPTERAKYDQGLIAPAPERKPPKEEAQTYFNRGEGAEKIKDYAVAVECYRRAASLDPVVGKYFYRLAVVSGRNPNWRRQATEAFEKALALEPRNVEYSREYARFLMQIGMKLRAQKIAKQALALAPGDAELKAWAQDAPQDAAAKPGGGLFGKFSKK